MELEQFLENSALARKIRLDSRVVIHRCRLSHENLTSLTQQGHFTPAAGSKNICELEVAGKVLAYGKIVKRDGEYYFKVTGLAADSSSAARHATRLNTAEQNKQVPGK